MSTATITAPLVAEPELSEPRCPNGHDSRLQPKCPALMFVACHHYDTRATWNEYCITCGVHHAPFRIYWRVYSVDGSGRGERGRALPKDYCGYCGAKMTGGRR